ncbi:MAG: hypothetical protein ISQ09_05680 [Rubripirellula sp.]|nr:hypothetical protein [Rubripirellula sp.]
MAQSHRQSVALVNNTKIFASIPSRLIIGLMILLAQFNAVDAVAQVEVTQLFALSRTGGQRGTAFEVSTALGNHLTEIDSLVFSNPLITAELVTSDPRPFSEDRVPQFGQFRVNIPAEIEPGRYEVRASGRNGLSNPRSFLVTAQTHQTPASLSHDEQSPTELPLNTFLHADATAAAIDFFRVQLDQPSRLHVEIVAQRLDSRMIPSCKIVDSNGTVIKSFRGADGFDATWKSNDPLPAGQYTLEVSDFIYRGGVDYHYQIFASFDSAIPINRSVKPSEGRLPVAWESRSVSMADFQEKAIADIVLSESDPSTPPTDAIESVSLPYFGFHTFSDFSKDRSFEFDAQQGQVIAVDVIADRLGDPTDGRILVQRIEPQESNSPTLHDIANFDDSQGISDGALNLISNDPSGLFTAPENARYRVSIRDLDVGSTLQTQKQFVLRIGPPQPSFDLVAYRPHAHSDLNQSQPTGTRLFRGSKEIIRLFAIRRDGWSGAIRVSCEGLPEGISAPEITIAANQSFAQIPIIASDQAPQTLSPIQLVGRSEDGTIERQASAVVVQWGKGGGRDFIQTRQTDSLWVKVSENDQIPISASFDTAEIVEVKKGEAVKIPLRLQRQEGGKAACVARARHFPPGIKAADLTIPAENNEGEIEIKTEPAAATGTYSLWLQVETKIKIQPNPDSVQRVQAYRDHLGKLLEAPEQQEQLEPLKAAVTEADKLVEAAKNASKEKEITVFLPTNIATLRVIDP